MSFQDIIQYDNNRGLAAINTPSPMLAPAFPNCEQFNQAVPGDTCDTMTARAQLPLEEFIRLNPGLGEDGAGCHTGNIVAGHWYCFKEYVIVDVSDKPEKAPRPNKPTKTKKQDEPKKTKDPLKPTAEPTRKSHNGREYCDWGSCWKSWVKLSTDGEEWEWTSALASCTRLATQACDNVYLPGLIEEGCNGCAAMSSGCACATDGLYHTTTRGLAYGEDS